MDREQRGIGRAEDRAQADGTVTPKERKHLNRMQDRASHGIHRQKHDRQHKHAPGAAASVSGK